MAREFDEAATANEAQAQPTSTEDTQAGETSTETGETSTDTATAEGSTEPAAAEETKPEEPKGPSQGELLAALDAAVTAALAHEGRDESTGTLPEEAISLVRTAYAPLNPASKTKARDAIQTRLTEHMTGEGDVEQDYQMAKSLLDLLNNLKAQPTRAPSITKEPVDPTEGYVDYVLANVFAPNFLDVPEGVQPGWDQKVAEKAKALHDQVQAYRNWLASNVGKEEADRTPAPEVDPVILSAVRIAKGRGTTARAPRKPKEGGERAPRQTDGVRRDIGTHIASAFENVPAGTFLTIGEIVNHKSAEYGDEKPSQGAIAARLFPKSGKSTIEGLRPEGPEQGREKKGAVKL